MKPIHPVLLLLATLPLHALERVDLSSPPGALFDPSGLGTATPVWNGPGRYETWAEGFRRGDFRVYRFPNGTLSNEYHWNGKGTYDSTGIWHSSATEVGPGFTVVGLWRGTSKNNYDARHPSHLTDGDTTTLWWGETLQDSLLPWAILDLGESRRFDAVEILWGDLQPRKVAVESFVGAPYPPPQHADPSSWKRVGMVEVKGGRSRVATRDAEARHVAIRPLDAPRGVKVREVRLFLEGRQVSVNVPDPLRQTKVVAISAHPGNASRPNPWIPEWTFDRFQEWLSKIPGAEPLICVNYGTGTPEEAAAWVRYANVVKKYGIRKWHVGNEVDGHWEEGGPVDPAQYAVRYAAFARAMKAVDPTIEVYGPATYSTEFQVRRSGRDDHLSWIESFLVRIAAEERRTGERLLDGVDFHSYPYWYEVGPAREDSMLAAIGRFGSMLDTLSILMARTLDKPESRKISLSEFNTTVKVTAITLESTTGIGVAMMLQDLYKRFPERAVSILWEPSGGDPMNPDGSPIESYGSLRIFTAPKGGLRSDLGDPPTGAFWGQAMTRAWIGSPRSRTIPLAPTSGPLRIAASTDSTIWSVFAINPSTSPETLAVRWPKGVPSKGEVLTWGDAQYHWTDRTSEARALPNLGPTARRAEPADSLLVVAPRSMAILRRGREAAGTPKVLHAAWTPSRLGPADTLDLFASVASPGRMFKGATWKLGASGGKLPAHDGAWDASQEAIRLRVPAAQLPRGVGQTLRLEFAVDGAPALSVPIPLDNEDSPRALRILDDFDVPDMRATNGQTWWVYGNGNNGTRIQTVQSVDAEGGHFQAEFQIIQPPSQNYPNFALAGLNVGKADYASDWSRYRGLVFDIRSRHSGSQGRFLLQALTTTVKDYDDFQAVLPTTGSWKRVWLRWDELDQAGWGRDMGAFDPSTLKAIQFRADGEGSGSIEIENLAFWGTEGEAVPLVVPPRPSRGPVGR